jgi:putative membrane protein
MAGMLYLPRLYVYHTSAKSGSELDTTFKLMELRLLRYIMNPAMIIVYITGFMNAYIYGFEALGVWFKIKFTAVVLLTLVHGLFAKWRKMFSNNQNIHSANFYRVINEVPTILMIIAVCMVIIKPFD